MKPMTKKQTCNPCVLPDGVKPYGRSKETLSERQTIKKERQHIKLYTSARGRTKNDFIEDCQRRGLAESEVLRQIVKLHYKMIEQFPGLKGKEFSDMVKVLAK
jgi:hypothetical protein